MNLFIDTHLNDVVIILSSDNKIIKEEIIKNEKQNSKIIMPTIKEVLGDIPNSSFSEMLVYINLVKSLSYSVEEYKGSNKNIIRFTNIEWDFFTISFCDKAIHTSNMTI